MFFGGYVLRTDDLFLLLLKVFVGEVLEILQIEAPSWRLKKLSIKDILIEFVS